MQRGIVSRISSLAFVFESQSDADDQDEAAPLARYEPKASSDPNAAVQVKRQVTESAIALAVTISVRRYRKHAHFDCYNVGFWILALFLPPPTST